jgi:DNA-binding transcriptional LysR family regulator
MLAVIPASIARHYQSQKMIGVLPTALRGQLAPYGLVLHNNRRITPATQLVIDAIRQASATGDPG